MVILFHTLILFLLLTFPAYGADDFSYQGDSYSRVYKDYLNLRNKYDNTDMKWEQYLKNVIRLAERANKLVEADSLKEPKALKEDGYRYIGPYNCSPEEACKILDQLERFHNITTNPDLMEEIKNQNIR